jgi:hypothetical protein
MPDIFVRSAIRAFQPFHPEKPHFRSTDQARESAIRYNRSTITCSKPSRYTFRGNTGFRTREHCRQRCCPELVFDPGSGTAGGHEAGLVAGGAACYFLGFGLTAAGDGWRRRKVQVTTRSTLRLELATLPLQQNRHKTVWLTALVEDLACW